MLSNIQIEDLAKKMEIPLETPTYKDQLKTTGKFKHNRCYIVNLHDKNDEFGNYNEGSHWVCFYVCEYKNGKKAGIYFDSYGQPPPTDIKEYVGTELPHNTKDIQSLMNNACGFYCLALLHFVTAFPKRSGDLYSDVEAFLSLFDDLNTSCDWQKNEFLLKKFFQPVELGKNITNIDFESIDDR